MLSNYLSRCLILQVHVPPSCMLDGVHSQHFFGTGVIVHHSQFMGLVAVDKNTVAISVSDVMLSFAAFPMEIPGEVTFHFICLFILHVYQPWRPLCTVLIKLPTSICRLFFFILFTIMPLLHMTLLLWALSVLQLFGLLNYFLVNLNPFISPILLFSIVEQLHHEYQISTALCLCYLPSIFC